jgi:hypothetical protein
MEGYLPDVLVTSIAKLFPGYDNVALAAAIGLRDVIENVTGSAGVPGFVW